MERKIGEIFEYKGEWYQCVKDNSDKSCANCHFFSNDACEYNVTGHCASFRRDDGISVCFKKLEKVGEPYASACPSGRNIYFQRYGTYVEPIINSDIISYTTGGLNFINLEIKQNQEDMEEKIQHYDCFFDKEKSNLKPFDDIRQRIL